MQHRPGLGHSLRLLIFLLRVVVGLNLFYLALGQINPAWAAKLNLRVNPGGFAQLLGMPSGPAWLTPLTQWAFLIIGIGLVVGLATRLVSVLGTCLLGFIYLSNLNTWGISLAQVINEQSIFILCLFLFVFAHAGSYLGLDKFFHFSLWRKK